MEEWFLNDVFLFISSRESLVTFGRWKCEGHATHIRESLVTFGRWTCEGHATHLPKNVYKLIFANHYKQNESHSPSAALCSSCSAWARSRCATRCTNVNDNDWGAWGICALKFVFWATRNAACSRLPATPPVQIRFPIQTGNGFGPKIKIIGQRAMIKEHMFHWTPRLSRCD